MSNSVCGHSPPAFHCLHCERSAHQALKAELAKVRGQRDGLARVIRSGGPIPHGTFDKIPTYMMAKASSILQELAQEQGAQTHYDLMVTQMDDLMRSGGVKS